MLASPVQFRALDETCRLHPVVDLPGTSDTSGDKFEDQDRLFCPIFILSSGWRLTCSIVH